MVGIMKYSGLDKMISIVSKSFKGKFDKGGHPYILHCARVGMAMPKYDYKAQTIGWGHDLLEDTHWTADMLYAEGFSPIVVTSIETLTHKSEDSYETYIKNIGKYKLSVMVKLADLTDNMDPTRLKGIMDKDVIRMDKYMKAYAYLSKVIQL